MTALLWTLGLLVVLLSGLLAWSARIHLDMSDRNPSGYLLGLVGVPGLLILGGLWLALLVFRHRF